MGDGYLKADRHRPVSYSDGFIRFINVVAVLLAIALISLGIWLATRPGDCERYATVPVFLIGAFFLLVAMLGLFGAWFALVQILYAYLVLTFVVVVGFLILTIFLFATTSKGGGYSVAGQTFKEYRLKDYSGYVQDRVRPRDSKYVTTLDFEQLVNVQKQLNKVTNWDHLKAVIAASDNCAKFDRISPVDYPYSKLNPIQSGCCRPPSECGYAMTGNGTFTTTSVPLSANPDCTRYSNDDSIKCYDCDSCKGGVAQSLKKTGRAAGIITLILFFILVVILVTACHAGHRVAREHWSSV